MSTGPIEVLVLGFPGNQFSGEILPELANLVDSGQIAILDLEFVAKTVDGDVVTLEAADMEEGGWAELTVVPDGDYVDKGLEAAQAAITGGTTLALTRDLLAGLGDLLSQRKDDLDDAFGQASECQ